MPAGAVWLCGDFEKQPGLMGFLYSARKEHKGNCVRALINWGQPSIEYQKAVLEASKLDLCMNVFRNGKNGLYAPIETEVRNADLQAGCCMYPIVLRPKHRCAACRHALTHTS